MNVRPFPLRKQSEKMNKTRFIKNRSSNGGSNNKMCLLDPHHPIKRAPPAGCEKTFFASFVPQPAKNYTLHVFS
jgi:hypothetical protein